MVSNEEQEEFITLDAIKPLRKDHFKKVLKDTAFFTRMIVAPYGTLDVLGTAFGGDSQAIKMISDCYHSWEEVVSRVLYLSKGVPGASLVCWYRFCCYLELC